ncbi:TonB-dependent Receptor Plug Domain [Bryocella elongata]|uniref:TonB-dependent Receptor Plug Domain n=1 Tax=Bryocella elongata TaxID=863522 RepID=A0A1H6BPY7_9BACT|nr:TonB-dependent Receptor Plug Domain [Bryocella elongata]
MTVQHLTFGHLRRHFRALGTLLFAAVFALTAAAQSNSGTVSGTVTDSTGAAIPGASLKLFNAVSGYSQATTSDAQGHFQFPNVPFHGYSLNAASTGFQTFSRAVSVDSAVGVTIPITLSIATSSETITVDAPMDLVESDPTSHTDIDRSLISHMPIESASSELSAIVTQASPGVAADSNGMMHGLGDHAENSFSIDGQPITDQQSKVFSNSVPAAAVQSLEVIEGAPPAEYGDKTSLVVKATTRSGQGVTTPTGEINASYGSFGSSSVGFDLSYGGKNWGNFIAASGLNTARFLDSPEFTVLHDQGNETNLFDRIDVQPGINDTLHFNVQYTRSWFQTPNDFENLGVQDQNGNTLGNTDQRSRIETVNFSPSWTHTISSTAVSNLGFYVRRDSYNYYPSHNPLLDFAPSQQQESVAQQRSLMNTGAHGDISYVKGIHNAKAGFMYEQTFLRENLQTGLTDPGANAPCLDSDNNPVNGYTSTTQCSSAGYFANNGTNYNAANPNASALPTPFAPVLLGYDFTRGGSYYSWHGRADVKQLALYAQDQITAGPWQINFGVRGDFYNGLTIQRQAEPRTGLSYTIKKTGTVLRISYARTQETPFNENLVLSSTGCADAVIYAVFNVTGGCTSNTATPFNPGFRNEFHAGISQSIGSHFVFTGEYLWKYTHNAYDFSVFGTTPITFPIEWHNSKIPGYAISFAMTDWKGISGQFNASSVAARFFSPQIGGVGAVPASASTTANVYTPFRIDHDERFNETTHVQYNMPFRKSLWYGVNFRYDSGLVAGAAPCYNANASANTDCLGFSLDANGNPLTQGGQPLINLSRLTADQQFQAGLVCNGVKATPTAGFDQCLSSQLTSNLIKIPASGTEDADKSPTRIAPRALFDMAMGDDDLFHFHHDRYKFSARVTAINVTNKYALYNFLSTFSGTHYVTPRSVTGELAFHF